MTKQTLFWLLFIVGVIVYAIVKRPWTSKEALADLITFVLIGLLGWRVFGDLVN